MESGPRGLINTVLEGGGPDGKQLVMDLIQEMLSMLTWKSPSLSDLAAVSLSTKGEKPCPQALSVFFPNVVIGYGPS